MEEALLFEHLVNDNCIKCNNCGANLFRACLSETDTYENGFHVGTVYAYMKVALQNLYKESSKEKQEFIQASLDKMNEPCGYDDLCKILRELNDSKIIL